MQSHPIGSWVHPGEYASSGRYQISYFNGFMYITCKYLKHHIIHINFWLQDATQRNNMTDNLKYSTMNFKFLTRKKERKYQLFSNNKYYYCYLLTVMYIILCVYKFLSLQQQIKQIFVKQEILIIFFLISCCFIFS